MNVILAYYIDMPNFYVIIYLDKIDLWRGNYEQTDKNNISI